ncbi:phage baseplate assembly protein V [Pseudomonas sp. D1-3]|uniref:phage baseplate assembly protein V n=1 Tax=Phytopseudomonas argentinensis TaxID=289370 RepID=UPI0008A8B874|nr:phage baseplate assembly protein V [Pseudomonas argentinensis]
MNIADIIRRLENMIRFGTIAEVDHAKSRCRVSTGGIITNWLPFFSRRAGSTNEWDPVSVGEQCVVFCPSGDPAVGIVLAGIYSEANPAKSSDPAVHRVEWANGDYVEHHAETGAYALKVSGHVDIQAASLSIQCSGAVSINGSRIDLN